MVGRAGHRLGSGAPAQCQRDHDDAHRREPRRARPRCSRRGMRTIAAARCSILTDDGRAVHARMHEAFVNQVIAAFGDMPKHLREGLVNGSRRLRRRRRRLKRPARSVQIARYDVYLERARPPRRSGHGFPGSSRPVSRAAHFRSRAAPMTSALDSERRATSVGPSCDPVKTCSDVFDQSRGPSAR